MGYPLVFPFWGLAIFACVGRFADVASTVLALRTQFLAEGAPSLGSSPRGSTLLKLAICQVVLILIGVIIFYDSYVLRVLLILVALVSFAATNSNLMLTRQARELEKEQHRLRQIFIGEFTLLDIEVTGLTLTEIYGLLVSVPLAGLFVVLVSSNLVLTILGAVIILFLYVYALFE
ncbi:MAG: hypothetical protein OEZ00_03175 [Dehalococcoidia bacterium]|nr:hypothetical protein [Dehalococcoidia bacterium]